ncbi:MAG: hypothetical protein II875_08830, partial [Clostridia bacterium]|nr:hypothetical protein [Clostridia bacterium]
TRRCCHNTLFSSYPLHLWRQVAAATDGPDRAFLAKSHFIYASPMAAGCRRYEWAGFAFLAKSHFLSASPLAAESFS